MPDEGDFNYDPLNRVWCVCRKPSATWTTSTRTSQRRTLSWRPSPPRSSATSIRRSSGDSPSSMKTTILPNSPRPSTPPHSPPRPPTTTIHSITTSSHLGLCSLCPLPTPRACPLTVRNINGNLGSLQNTHMIFINCYNLSSMV